MRTDTIPMKHEWKIIGAIQLTLGVLFVMLATYCLEALLLAACEIVVHNDGNVNKNMEAARQQLANFLEYSKVKHAHCIESLTAQGIQYDEVH